MWIRDYVRKSPISVQLTAWFLLIALLPLAAVSYVLSQNFAQALAHTVTNDLRAIAGRQVRQLEAYFRERERSVIILAQVPQVVSAMEKLDRLFKQRQPDAATHAAIVEDVRPFLQHYQELFGSADLFLISPDGTVGFSMRGGPGGIRQQAVRDSQHAELAKAFDRAKTLLETGLSNFAYDPQTRELTAFLAAPVLQEKKLIGVVALQIRSQEVYAMVNDLTGLGESGETLLAARVGSEVVFVTPPRHGAHEKIVHTADSVMVQAVLGAKGSGATTDYRGQEVLAVWQYLASLGNGLVMKIDLAEAFAPIARLRLLALMIGLLTLGLVVLAAVFVARSFSRPIVRLTAMTEAIARGDLTQRIDIPLHNEIGLLASIIQRHDPPPRRVPPTCAGHHGSARADRK